jgi:hypothetical protein
MDTIQKTAAQIIEVIEIHLIGEHTESAESEESLSSDRALVGV